MFAFNFHSHQMTKEIRGVKDKFLGFVLGTLLSPVFQTVCICSLVWTSFHVPFTPVSNAISRMRAITLTREIQFVNCSRI